MRAIKFSLLAVAAMAAVSCAKEITPENNETPEVNPNLVEITLTATGESDEETKAVFSGYPKIAWEGNEEISLLGTNTGNQKLTANGKGHQTTFTGYADVTDETYYAVYPYDANVSLTADGKLSNVTVPAIQTATAGSFDPKAYIAVAKSTDKESLYFKAVGAFVKFKLEDAENVKSVTMVSNSGANMACSATVVMNENGGVSHGSPYVDGTASSSVKMVGDFQTDKAYFMVVRPQPYTGGVTFYIEYKDGTVLSRTGESALFESGMARNYIRNLNTLQKKDFKPVTDLYALYNMGYDITLAGKVINKAMYGEATLITENTNLTTATTNVYFVDSAAELTYNIGSNLSKLIIIGNDPEKKSRINASSQFRLVPTDENDIFVLYNMDIIGGASNLFTLNANGAYKYVGFINSNINMGTNKKPIYYMANADRIIDTFTMDGCNFVTSGDTQYIIQLAKASTTEYPNIIFRNNIFYSTEENGHAEFYLVGNGTSTPVGNFIVDKNTFANVYPVNRNNEVKHYSNILSVTSYTCANNLFYLPLYDTTYGSKYTNVLNIEPTSHSIENNLVYKTSNTDRIRTYKNGNYTSRTSNQEKAVSSVDLDNGIIVPATTAGATR